jgi:hypothetical protein
VDKFEVARPMVVALPEAACDKLILARRTEAPADALFTRCPTSLVCGRPSFKSDSFRGRKRSSFSLR